MKKPLKSRMKMSGGIAIFWAWAPVLATAAMALNIESVTSTTRSCHNQKLGKLEYGMREKAKTSTKNTRLASCDTMLSRMNVEIRNAHSRYSRSEHSNFMICRSAMRAGIDCMPESTLIWIHMKRNGICCSFVLEPVSKKPIPTMTALTMAVKKSVRRDLRSRIKSVNCRPNTARSCIAKGAAYTELLGMVSGPRRASMLSERSFRIW
mmetsp:Transcript_96400/g.132715  ORF Transcript_96400/g.132715 Transcript_96400/m.132715 type:complete len:208 (+) Transcript_96400:848-1471(+)